MGPSLKELDGVIVIEWESAMDALVADYLQILDAIPHHFQLHLMHAFQIVGYKHPDDKIRSWFKQVYYRLVKDMHLRPEPEEDMDDRLSDNRERWLAHGDPATSV